MSLAVARREEEMEPTEGGSEAEAEEERASCGVTFQPRWQETLWCACDRPRGHSGEHFGMPRAGRWSNGGLLRVG